MRRCVTVAALLTLVGSLGLGLTRGPTPVLAAVDSSTRTVVFGPFVVRWSLSDPEAIRFISWNGSVNLTGEPTSHPNCPQGGDNEFFGNSWGGGDGESFISPVGWGSTGTWTAVGDNGVAIASAATAGCWGTSGIPVTTTYRFLGTEIATARIEIERTLAFGSTPFTADVRPYIARLGPRSAYSQMLHPNAAGSALVRHGSLDCGGGCQEVDWNRTWFAVHDPTTGNGMIVRYEALQQPAALWVDNDGATDTSATALLVRQTGIGMTGTLATRQTLCFYDRTLWVPSLALPVNCSGPWSGTQADIGSKLGVASGPISFTASTKVASVGQYVTWQARMGPDARNRSVGVWVATRRADGTWTGFSRLTSRTADASGVVAYSRRETAQRWISVRFAIDTVTSAAGQARWR